MLLLTLLGASCGVLLLLFAMLTAAWLRKRRSKDAYFDLM